MTDPFDSSNPSAGAQNFQNSADGTQEDRIHFGVVIGHPSLDIVALDAFGEAADDLARRFPEKKISWEDVDRELGVGPNAMPVLIVNGEAHYLTPEKLKWLAIQAQATYRALEGIPALADETWAKARRQVRGEVPKN